MSKLTAVWFCLALLIVLGPTVSYGSQASDGSAGHTNLQTSTSSVDAIRAEVERFRQAILHKDMQGVARYYWNSPDIVIFDTIPPLSYVGWDSFRKDWEGFFDGFKEITVYDWSDVHIEAEGNLGWMRAIVHIVGTLQDGKPLNMTFRDTAIFERKNGKWVVVHDHGSVPISGLNP